MAWWFAFLAAFLWDFEDFFIAFRCCLEAFFSFLFCALADFLSNSRELRAYSATPGLCALAGTDQATFPQISNAKTAIRFMPNFPLAPNIHQFTPSLRFATLRSNLVSYFTCDIGMIRLPISAVAGSSTNTRNVVRPDLGCTS